MGSESGYDIDNKNDGDVYPFHVHHITYPYTTIRSFQNYGEAEAFIWGLENMAKRHSVEGWAPKETDKVTGLSLIEIKSGAWKVLDRKGNMFDILDFAGVSHPKSAWKVLDRKGNMVGIFESKARADLWLDGVRCGMGMAQEIVFDRLATLLDLPLSDEFVITKPE